MNNENSFHHSWETSLKLTSPVKSQLNTQQSNRFKFISPPGYNLFDLPLNSLSSFTDDSESNSKGSKSFSNGANWKNLLEPEFTIKQLISLVYCIIQVEKIDFVNEFKARLSKNIKQDKDKVLSLRNELFKHLYLILGYPPTSSLCLPVKNACAMIEDIHVLCECYASRTLKADVLDLFAAGTLGIQDEFNRTLLDCINHSNKNMNELRDKMLLVAQENAQLRERLNVVEVILCNLATSKFGMETPASDNSSQLTDGTYASVTKANLAKISEQRQSHVCTNCKKANNDDSSTDGFVGSYEKKKAFSSEIKPKVIPYSYYIGQWDMETKPELVIKWVSRFAKLIEVTELATNRPNRVFRSFRVVVESTSDSAMWDKKNWPKGVVVERFFEKKLVDLRVVNLPITNHKAIELSSDSDKNKSVEESNRNEQVKDDELKKLVRKENKKKKKKLRAMQLDSMDPKSEDNPIYFPRYDNDDDEDKEPSIEGEHDDENEMNSIYFSDESAIETNLHQESAQTQEK